MGEKNEGKIPRKAINEIIAVAVGILIALIPPPDGLAAPAMWVLGLLVWGMANWVLQPIPTFVTMLIMCCMWIILGILPFDEAFSNFAGSTVWLLIGALAIGVGASKSGLLKRMALLVLKLFKPTYNGMLLAFLCSGVILGPAIPSSLAKGSIVGPVSTNIAGQLGFKNKSNGMAGIFTAMFAGYSLLTASCIVGRHIIAGENRKLKSVIVPAVFCVTGGCDLLYQVIPHFIVALFQLNASGFG